MNLLAFVFVFFLANLYETRAAPATSYDQRQTGDLNVLVQLKDIQIMAILGGDEEDYDYSYDFTDFTLKPIIPPATTSASSGAAGSSSTTVEPWHTWPTVSGAPSTSTVSEVISENVTVDSLESESENAKPESEIAKPEPEIAKPEPENPKPESEIAKPEPGNAKPELKNTKPSSGGADDAATIKASDESPSTTSSIRVVDRIRLADESLSEKDPIAAVIPASAELQASSTDGNPPSSTATGNSEEPDDQSQAQPSRKCSPGYTRDQKGRCSRLHTRRRIPVSLLPFGIRLTPRIHRPKDQLSAETVEN